ncbi:gastrula zinc finger -like, partial [Brachionus plicatilis]
MEWNTHGNDREHTADNQHTTLHNSNMNDFANINTNTYDLNQFNQLINLNNSSNHQELVQSNNSIHIIQNRNHSLNQNGQDLLRNLNNQASSNVSHTSLSNLTTNSNLIKTSYDVNQDKSGLILIQNKEEMVQYSTIFQNDMLIAEFLNSNPLEQNHEHMSAQAGSTNLEHGPEESMPKKNSPTKFNYKCNYCLHLTKFKAHIIEHMLTEHKIDLMQCPYPDCLKKFKDEWKLKRHLTSNKDHLQLGTYKDLNDCLKLHVHITPQRIGQYPCPLCQIEPSTGSVLISHELDQEISIQNLVSKNLDNSLFFDKYQDLVDHCSKSHPAFNMDTYFVCKTCGQVFLNRYKLSCHHFNVHSGKRKPRNKSQTFADLSQMISLDPSNSDNIADIIDSVAKGQGSVDRLSSANKLRAVAESVVHERKYLCVVCARKFKRVRDLQTHVQIMHKNLTEAQKQELKAEIDKTNLVMAKTRRARSRVLIDYHSANLLSTNDPSTKVCFICKKVFRAVHNHAMCTAPGVTHTFNLAKSFQRHLQIQHGINEKGEKLIDCPVCEKSFFAKIQLERHLRTHQVWIEDDGGVQAGLSEDPVPEHRTKHSILYCHECVECSIFFKSMKILTKHKKDAHHLKPVFKCANTIDCNQQFDSIDAFMDHSKVHMQKNIVCSKCRVKFANKNTLRIHMKNFHYKTSLGKKSGASRSRKLVEMAHSGPMSEPAVHDNKMTKSEFTCPTCRQEFATRNSLHNHLATHSPNDLKLFMCTYCNLSFKTRKELSQHVATHDSHKHKSCDKCGETFKTSFHLKRHALTRHSDKRPFKCNHCEMTFARKDKLKQHEAKHVNHPLYKCAECGKGFYRKEHLKDHEISKHSKEYPFTCEHCTKGFVHAKDLHRHIRVRHLGNQSPKLKKSDDSAPNFAHAKQTECKGGEETCLGQKMVYQMPHINANIVNGDFKSRKISSILKSNYVPQQAEPPKPSVAQSVINQAPILLTQAAPIQFLNEPSDKMLVNPSNCQIITLRINDLNSIFDKLNSNQVSI